MALPESWHVRSRSRKCAATEQPFTDGQPIVTALFPDPESSGYLRKDFAADAWQEIANDEPAPFSVWKSTYSVLKSDPDEDPVKQLSPEEILQRLVEEDEDHTENTRYILAVMLERKKLLRETDSQRTPTGILRVYEHRKTGEVYLVRDPDLPLDQIETVQQEVFLLLENNGRMPNQENPENPENPPQETDTAETPAEPPAATPEDEPPADTATPEDEPPAGA